MAEMPHVCVASNHVQMQEKIIHPSRQHPTHHGIVSIVVLKRSAYGKSAYPTFQFMTQTSTTCSTICSTCCWTICGTCAFKSVEWPKSDWMRQLEVLSRVLKYYGKVWKHLSSLFSLCLQVSIQRIRYSAYSTCSAAKRPCLNHLVDDLHLKTRIMLSQWDKWECEIHYAAIWQTPTVVAYGYFFPMNP